MSKLSVIVPVYNVCAYIEQCIQSIIKQSYIDIEIILVDDGSTDGSGEICDKFSIIDSRIKVLHKKNGGLVSARKAGVRIATGDYITYVDGDDWIEPLMYEHMMSETKNGLADVVIQGYLYDDGKKVTRVLNKFKEGIYEGGNIESLYERMLSYNLDGAFEFGIIPTVWCKIFKKELIIDAQIKVNEKITIGEDVAVTFPVLLNAKCIVISGHTDYHYRVNLSSMTKKYDKNYFMKLNELRKYMDNWIEDKNIGKQLGPYYFFLIYMAFCLECEPRNFRASICNQSNIYSQFEQFGLQSYDYDRVKKGKISYEQRFISLCEDKKLWLARIIYLIRKAMKYAKYINCKKS